ncbi:hypothetical protein [Litchfieldia salsa]|uniref:Uncharacterized protein n=1 Tax=Litchfieldia salsa TaxID=930152 RepID=A0A1H0PRS7_9BACI|nr:hypothetical protein [Litchfieldia salsa]SDP07269.1 hypothetical protein SAMN05216565_101423 [Litchfieldia salsa]
MTNDNPNQAKNNKKFWTYMIPILLIAFILILVLPSEYTIVIPIVIWVGFYIWRYMKQRQDHKE